MSELADLLELVHTAVRRWHTVAAAGSEWRDEVRLLTAFRRSVPPGGAALTTYRAGGVAPPAPPTRERWRLWVARPDRFRAEFVVGQDTMQVVIVGATWWSWSDSGLLTTNAADPGSSHGIGPGEALLDPALILPAVDLAVTGRDTVAGRPAIAAVATPMAVDGSDEEHADWSQALHGLGLGADEYRLAVDAASGLLLRSEARLDGQPFRILDVDRLAVDEALPAATFEPPPGRDAEPTRAALPRSVPLSGLADEVSFVVLVPACPPFPPDGAVIMPAEPRSGSPPQVHIAYASNVDGEEDHSFTVFEAGEPLPERPDGHWRDDGDVRVGEDARADPPLRLVRLERHGTHVEILSHHLEVDELLGLARSLVALPGGRR